MKLYKFSRFCSYNFWFFYIFSCCFRLIRSTGIFVESGNFFLIIPYTKLISLKIPFFSDALKRSIYFFPKYRFFNHFNTHKLFLKTYTVFYSIFATKYNIVFKYLRTFNHFWFYCFLFKIFPKKMLKRYIAFEFKYVLFSKTFSGKVSRNFFFFCKMISKEYLLSLIYKMLKIRYHERRKHLKKKKIKKYI